MRIIVIFLAIFSLFDPADNIRGGLPFYNYKNRTENETGDREKKTQCAGNGIYPLSVCLNSL